jgi:hypothetical protein
VKKSDVIRHKTVLTIAITFVARPYVRIGEEMPDLVIKLEFRKSLDQDTLDLTAFRVPMLSVYLIGERQGHEPFYFYREIPGCFRRAAYIEGNLFAPSKHVEKIRYQNNRATCGQKIIAPITTAAIAVTRTAPAATSFASRTSG